jgi:hypothetical protein
MEHPSGDNYPAHLDGERRGHETLKISNITHERTNLNAHPLRKRFTKFTQNYHGQVRIPRDLLSANRLSGDLSDPQGQRHIDVGQIPED